MLLQAGPRSSLSSPKSAHFNARKAASMLAKYVAWMVYLAAVCIIYCGGTQWVKRTWGTGCVPSPSFFKCSGDSHSQHRCQTITSRLDSKSRPVVVLLYGDVRSLQTFLSNGILGECSCFSSPTASLEPVTDAYYDICCPCMHQIQVSRMPARLSYFVYEWH